MPQVERSWLTVFAQIVHRAHLATPDQIAGIFDDAVGLVGLSTELYLVDLGQRELHPVRPSGGEPLSVQGTVAGRSFTHLEIMTVPEADTAVLWVPVLNGTERLGVTRIALPAEMDAHDTEVRSHCWTLAGLMSQLVLSKQLYGDLFHQVRRTRPLSVASELLWQLLPPTVFACDRAVVAAAMEPYDQVGGDGYDYAVNDKTAYVAIFDAVGHDLRAGLITSIALAATRNARRAGSDLIAAAEVADQTIDAHRRPRTMDFATAVLAQLELGTGRLSYLNAGHPAPVLLRAGRGVRVLEGASRPPLGVVGLPADPPHLTTEQLEPGDRILFYSDGVTEARSPEGHLFGLDRLVDLTERHELAGLPAPETLRRVVHAVLEHQNGELQDDATIVMLEWTTTDQIRMLPTI